MSLLKDRYDLGDHPAQGVTMPRGKAVQEGVRVKLGSGATWDSLANMTPDEIKNLHLDDVDNYQKRLYFWQNVPRRAKYNEIWNEVKAAQ